MANIMADWWAGQMEEIKKNREKAKLQDITFRATKKTKGKGISGINVMKEKERQQMGTTPSKPKTTTTSTTRDSVRDLDLQRTSALKTKTAKTTPKATTTAKSGTTKLTKSTSGKSSLPAMRAAEKAKLSQKEKTYMKPLKEKNVKKPLPSKDPKAIREDYKAPLRKMGSNNPYVQDLLKRLKK